MQESRQFLINLLYRTMTPQKRKPMTLMAWYTPTSSLAPTSDALIAVIELFIDAKWRRCFVELHGFLVLTVPPPPRLQLSPPRLAAPLLNWSLPRQVCRTLPLPLNHYWRLGRHWSSKSRGTIFSSCRIPLKGWRYPSTSVHCLASV